MKQTVRRLVAVRVCLGACLIVGAFAHAGTTAPSPSSTASPPASSQPSSGPATAPEAEARLGIVRFTSPNGWRAAQQPNQDAILFVSPDSNGERQATIVVLLTPSLGQAFDFRARFERAVEKAADARPIADRGPVVAGKSRQGHETLEQTFAYKNAAGQTVRVRLVAARIGDRLAAFWYLASTDRLFIKHASDLTSLLGTVSFEAPAMLPATAPATRPASNPAPTQTDDPALQAIEREKSELRRRLAALESREQGPQSGPTSAADTGESPGGHGAGSIDVTDRSPNGAWLRARYPGRTRLVITLTPPQPESSEIRTISCDIGRLPDTAHFTGFPSGSYRLTAKAVTPDDKTWPLKVTISDAPKVSDWADAAEVDPSMGASIGVTDAPK